MKKKMVLLLSLIMVLSMSFYGCGSGNDNDSEKVGSEVNLTDTKASIEDNDGAIVELSATELLEIDEENGAKFDQKYKEAKATIVGTVQSVDSVSESFGSTWKKVYKLNLEEGWCITLLEEAHPEVIDLSKGDKVEVTSIIKGASVYEIDMYDIGMMAGDWCDDTQVIIK